MTENLFSNEIVYHIYPYGMCDCLRHNDFLSLPSNNIELLENELPKIKKKGFSTIIIGPLCESFFHGYDTVDYFQIDRRLGTTEMMKSFCKTAHDLGMKVVIDVVFNHSGRLFFAFKDVQRNKENSPYVNWYNIDFSRNSEFNDGFDYEGWQGCKDLVKYNLKNKDTQNYLFDVLKYWIETFDIDGLRIDAAHLMDSSFLKELTSFAKIIKSDFWVLGEVIHEIYSSFIAESNIDSCTDYQLYEHFHNCFNQNDFNILGYELERQFGKNGIYKNNSLYIFADNQDVNRVASNLIDAQQLIPLYIILFSLPGIPSVYYGSEFGIKGKRTPYNDMDLRISIPPFSMFIPQWAYPDINPKLLEKTIEILCNIRKKSKALIHQNFEIIKVTRSFLCFKRWFEDEVVILGINIGNETEYLDVGYQTMFDAFSGELFSINNGIFAFDCNEIYLMSNKKQEEINEV